VSIDDLRVASCELRVAGFELQVASWGSGLNLGPLISHRAHRVHREKSKI